MQNLTCNISINIFALGRVYWRRQYPYSRIVAYKEYIKVFIVVFIK